MDTGREIKLPQLRLKKNNRLISEVCVDLSEILSDKDTLFYKPVENHVVEIRKIKHEEDEEVLGFCKIEPNRFITTIEKYCTPGKNVMIKKDKDEYEEVFMSNSINGNDASIILNSEILHNKLPKIQRIFTVPLPIMYKGNITFPKKGYDKRFKSWLPPTSPIIDPEMDLEEAKNIINNLYKEFPFNSNRDKIHAIAALLTPFLRGLYSEFNVRTPIFFYIANRERAGKDYCAGITGIIYEGYALEEPPISSNERRGQEDELRKKLVSVMMQGRKRLHFSNNKGRINNSVFEQIVTAPKYSDRLLGKNENLTFDNELEFTLSGNVGVTYTADFANRCRLINLILDIEDANKRKFDNPNLHQWVLNNRSKVLSSLYALVREWVNNGSKSGTKSFTSFHEWAEICGGIMENAGYESPCESETNAFNIGGDIDTENMKMFYETIYELKPEQWIEKKSLREIAIGKSDDIFTNINFNERNGLTKFGLLVDKFDYRIMSDIKMVSDKNPRPSRRKYFFTKNMAKNFNFSQHVAKKSGNVGNLGNVLQPTALFYNKKVSYSPHTIPTIPTLPHEEITRLYDILVKIHGKAISTKVILDESIIPEHEFDEAIVKLLEKGEYFEPKPGYIQKVE